MGMRALRWHGRGDLRLDEVEEPGPPGPGQAVVEVAYSGICGTDLHEFRHGPNLIRTGPHPLTGHEPPVTLGHEFSGRVTALGSPVPGIDVGTRVVVDPCLRCGVCRWCRHGEYHICAKGGSVGLAADGAFAPYVTVPVEGLVRIPDAVPDDLAALAEPLAVGLHAVRRGTVQPGDNVLILGAGPIGIAALFAAKLAGAAGVHVSEPVHARAERAARLGASEVFDPTSADVRREVFLRTGRVGPDVVIEATGLPSLVELAVTTVRRGGRVVLAGISGGAASLPITQIVPFERTVIGSLGYNYDIPRVLDLIAEKRFDPGALHTGTYPLSEGLAAFAELDADRGAHLKILLTPKEL
ncbi:threonine dehydrogenase and related Zn-dependent dehydrogenase [Amycolatopsis mediterranei S699]|uniref:Threonine dehydrogenase and related Zn-dependent dehydrogenase n=4 Tax=Amycolatopsis mediterranei TaxID=33910 RepID=A0A0H3DFH8_AMYMU|nr:2,3-butanediol dehydrogenase [Amycolatopsis mediterranei]ADJ48838.1 threonine dehydrogenase and related Zn-dependent dehydrogenase [Amycolatopsis mediterranei U32]AEK45784.1 threonine dehydrogenase and related Zn-dependent dehydrogenase [Amycolatopsis mediterranei S699]AFO80548.1 threonine dehydrogenase and related Zn-dependent dehydrogenase [Amycolatopsis mediterranei S699]AGT87676.1 threonine dehydrogenase-related Zn-dependent dehydrogenase [Amycolatopsis mediterranei RB]KDU94047.1 theron